MALTLYTNPMSRGRVARWMLEETGQPYETVILDFGSQMHGDAYRRVNPMGKVPALMHDGHVVTEGAAICAYLAEAFPEAGLMAADRASFHRWMFFAAGPLEQAVTNRALGVEVAPERQRMVGYGSYEVTCRTLADHVASQPFICGDRFSAADVYVGAQIGWGLQVGSLPADPAFVTYWDRIKDRPALARASAKDDALAAAQVPQ